jgi:hypothetical protein
MPEMDGGCGQVVALWEAFGAMKQHFGDNQAQMHNKKAASSLLVWAFVKDQQTLVCSHRRV